MYYLYLEWVKIVQLLGSLAVRYVWRTPLEGWWNTVGPRPITPPRWSGRRALARTPRRVRPDAARARPDSARAIRPFLQ